MVSRVLIECLTAPSLKGLFLVILVPLWDKTGFASDDLLFWGLRPFRDYGLFFSGLLNQIQVSHTSFYSACLKNVGVASRCQVANARMLELEREHAEAEDLK